MANKITLENDRRKQEIFRKLRKAIKEERLSTPEWKPLPGDKKSLTQIVGKTVAFAGLFYPLYSGFKAVCSQNTTFIEELKNPCNIGCACGVGITYFAYQGIKELVKRYKLKKE